MGERLWTIVLCDLGLSGLLAVFGVASPSVFALGA